MSVESEQQEEIVGIPKEWEAFRLGDVAEVLGGATPSTNVADYWNGEIPFVTPTDVTNLKDGNVLKSTEKSITKAGFNSTSAKCVPTGSVLLTSRATIGLCCINEIPVVTNQGFINLICKDALYNVYALYLIRSLKNELQRLSDGSTFKELARSSFRKISIVLPPLFEQHKIASILSSIDDSIQKTNEIQQKAVELKKGLLQDLLSKGVGHSKFKETKIGIIPEEWAVKEFGEVAFITKLAGFEFTESFVFEEDGPITVLRALNIRDNRIDLSQIQKISKDLSNSLSRSKAYKDDIIFTYVGRIGEAAIIPEDDKFHLGPNVARISINNKDKILPSYLLALISSSNITKQIFALTSVTSQPSLSMSKIRKLVFPVPTPLEQQKIVNLISSLESKIEKLNQRRQKLEQLKIGLMQGLLTGILRVKVV